MPQFITWRDEKNTHLKTCRFLMTSAISQVLPLRYNSNMSLQVRQLGSSAPFANPTELIVIFGLGREGWSSYQYLRLHKPKTNILISDDQPLSKLAPHWHEAIREAPTTYLDPLTLISQLEQGKLAPSSTPMVIVTPGLPLAHPLNQALSRLKLRPSSNTELFWQELLKAEIPPLTIGVTGTKGKSTTASLIHHLLKNGWKDSKYAYHFLAGNIGLPALEILPELEVMSDNFRRPGTIVLELSSHQLRLLSVSPHWAVVQNITAEHLDHFGDFALYQEAKSHLTRFQTAADFVIFNHHLEMPRQLAALSPATPLAFSTIPDENLVKTRRPTSPRSNYAAWIAQGSIWVSAPTQVYPAEPVDQTNSVNNPDLDKRTDQVDKVGKADEVNQEKVIELAELPLLGPHNWENIMPAVIIARQLGMPLTEMASALGSFQPLPHRLEKVALEKGVLYVNDSLATTPSAVWAALQSFPERPVVLLAGGYDRGLDLHELSERLFSSPLRALILFPTTGELLANQLKQLVEKTGHSLAYPLYHARSMAEAIKYARQEAQPGDVVLLSPGAASFGLFRDYADRGEQFKKAIT